ncbi:MAG: hypothetical protein C0623_03575 [Desulfuromonas sp.]|nr:MAG: hypothetical protein C0623_03575 [Desulfuromonas sp.]
MAKPCHIENYISAEESVHTALANAGAFDVLRDQRKILIKPNLVNASPPPITLPVSIAEALVVAISENCDGEIVIAEGSGDRQLSTTEIYQELGYRQIAVRHNIPLIDLNEAPLRRLEISDCTIFPEMYLPEILFESFVVSVPVLKAHSLADVTVSMKNMIGCAPPSHYQQGGYWKKSSFHNRMHQSIFELNRHRAPDLALVDASIGMPEYHLGGAHCEPPLGKLIVGTDPVAVDAAGAALLGLDWTDIEHIRMADGVLGSGETGQQTVSAL